MLDKHRARSLNNYIKAMKTAEECAVFSDGYEQAFKDLRAEELIERFRLFVAFISRRDIPSELMSRQEWLTALDREIMESNELINEIRNV